MLVVYNGENTFGFANTTFLDEGGEREILLSDGVFVLGDIYPEAGTRSVTLNGPGCIAIVKANIKPTVGESEESLRWASAMIVYKNLF